jgi:hypothetical protein
MYLFHLLVLALIGQHIHSVVHAHQRSRVFSAQQHLPQLGSARKYESILEWRKYQHLSENKLLHNPRLQSLIKSGKLVITRELACLTNGVMSGLPITYHVCGFTTAIVAT